MFKHNDPPYQRTNHGPPVLRIVHVARSEAGKPEYKMRLIQDGLCLAFVCDPHFNIPLLGLKLCDAFPDTYINKNLTTTQFRQWSIRRILTIIDYFSDVFSDEGLEKVKHLKLFQDSGWQRYKTNQRNILEKLAFAFLICRQKGISEYPIDLTPFDLYNHFQRETTYSFLLQCDVCEDTVIPFCSECEKSNFKILNGDIYCEDCRKICTSFKCDLNHFSEILDINSVLTTILSDELLKKVITELQMIDRSIKIGLEEYVAIHNGQLKI